MARLRSLALGAAAVIALTAVAPTVHAATAGGAAVAAIAPNGRIAYVAVGEATIPFGPSTQLDVWSMASDGTDAINLTASSDVDDFMPAWSPDGSRLAYISDSFTNTLMVMNADGSGDTAIMDGALSPSWGPDGTQIAVLRSDGVSVDVVIVDLTTGSQTVVTDAAAAPLMDPVWSPDGTRIAFVSNRAETYPDPTTGERAEGFQAEIVVVAVDGTGEVVVTAGDPGSDHATFLEEDRAPTWSPDGTMLAFMSQSQNPSCCGPWQIWAVNADGTGLTNLTADAGVDDQFPSWSPDGTAIVFHRAGQTGSDLYTMPAPSALPVGAQPIRALAAAPAAVTGEAIALTSDGNAQDPSWGALSALPTTYDLAVVVRRGPRAGGVVTSVPAGISCGKDCVETYDEGTSVTLVAKPTRGSVFVGWRGDCVGRRLTCTVTLDFDRSVTAVFRRR
jgi:dipeptidyl aminopeptidase/acylaminoacyl peptidase